MRGFAVLLALLIVLGPAGGVYGYGFGSQPSGNPIEDIINKIKEAILSAFKWLAGQLNSAFWGAVGPLLRAPSKPVPGNPIPEYADWGPVKNVSWYEVRVPEMLMLYEKTKLVAYVPLPLPIVLGALSIGLESFGLIREGEGMLMVKKSLWIAVLIPLFMLLYEYPVHLLSAITYYLCPPDTLSWYLGIGFGSIGGLAIIIDPLILLFILVVAVAGAVRILAIAIASLTIPLVAPMFVGRNGFASFAASALLGYTVYPTYFNQ